jgi:hypothetical protein
VAAIVGRIGWSSIRCRPITWNQVMGGGRGMSPNENSK